MAALGMKKESYFLSKLRDGWPAPTEIGNYFLTPAGRQQFFATRNDGGSLTAEGLYGTDHLEPLTGRVDVYLYFAANPEHGLYLQYTKTTGKRNDTYNSKGDLRRLKEFVRTFSGTPLCVALFVPFEQGTKAINEFIESNGELPKSIAWVANQDLPPETFPLP